MKKLLLLIALLFTGTLANAQLIVDSNYNWQQLIPTILGGGCVQISNVTFNSNQNASARFFAPGNVLGIQSGLLITTGKAVNASGPNDISNAGDDINGEGDANLESIIGAPTLDAVVLEFDFMSPEDDTVWVNYVFASEEYPEFVGTQYNDVFGFFVSGPGITGQQNIALIPGTSTAVAINNVNHISFNQFYVDNTSGLDCQYDGFTVPLNATFFAQAGVTYHLKIAIADLGDGFYDSGVFLKSYSGSWDDLTGTITHLNQPASDGIVEIFGFNTDSTASNLALTSALDNDGYYYFSAIPPGAYIMRSTLDPVTYPNTYPKYYNGSALWTDAQILSFPCDSFSIDISQMVLGGGNGEVSGTLSYTSNHFKIIEGGGALAGVNVFLINTVNKDVYGYCKTDSAGHYSFKNLKNGYYGIYVDVPGMWQQSVHEVTITSAFEKYTNQDYFVNDKIYTKNTEVQTTEVLLYPNPASNNFNIKINVAKNQKASIDLYDVMGRKVQNLYSGNINKGYNIFQADISTLPAGLYYARILFDDEKYIVKLLKQID